MTTLQEIEAAIKNLSEEELAKLRDWLDEYEAAVWDQQIERDAKSGKLKRLSEQALDDHRSGKTKEL